MPTFRQLLTPKFNDVQDIIKSYHASKLPLNTEKSELLRYTLIDADFARFLGFTAPRLDAREKCHFWPDFAVREISRKS